MTVNQERILSIIKDAIDKFNQNENYLIEHDLSERCICSKFASYIEREIKNTEFRDYDIDVEYNRGYKGNEYAAKIFNGGKVYADLIVHKRGYDEIYGFDNLVCIEMKKEYGGKDISSDLNRLQKFTDKYFDFKYQIGLMLLIRKKNTLHECDIVIHSTYFME